MEVLRSRRPQPVGLGEERERRERAGNGGAPADGQTAAELHLGGRRAVCHRGGTRVAHDGGRRAAAASERGWAVSEVGLRVLFLFLHERYRDLGGREMRLIFFFGVELGTLEFGLYIRMALCTLFCAVFAHARGRWDGD